MNDEQIAREARQRVAELEAAITEALDCSGGMCTHCIDVLLAVDPRQPKEKP